MRDASLRRGVAACGKRAAAHFFLYKEPDCAFGAQDI